MNTALGRSSAVSCTDGARIRLNIAPGELVASECGGWVAQKRRCYRRAYRFRADLRLRARRLQLAKCTPLSFGARRQRASSEWRSFSLPYCGAIAASAAQLALTLSRSELDLRLALEESGREDLLRRLPQALQQMLDELP